MTTYWYQLRFVLIWGKQTVPIAPAVTSKKLRDCCVERAAFSPVLSSDQWYRPSSEVTVMARLEGLLLVLVLLVEVFCVA